MNLVRGWNISINSACSDPNQKFCTVPKQLKCVFKVIKPKHYELYLDICCLMLIKLECVGQRIFLKVNDKVNNI